MKKLYLVRHAKSSWKNENLKDLERPLNKRGKRDAPFMGELLAKKNVRPDAVYSSPAVRAFDTAQLITGKLELPDETIELMPEIYEAGMGELLEIIRELPDEKQNVMLVGHNPGMTSLCNYISDKYFENIPTAAIAEIQFDLETWKDVKMESGKLLSFEFPKKYFPG